MDTRTLQVVLIAFVASSIAQNFQPQQQLGGFPSHFATQGSQSLTEEQQREAAFRAQEDFRKYNEALKAKRPPNLEVPARTVPQQPAHVQPSAGSSQRFQGALQPQPQTRTQSQVLQQQHRPAVRQQQPRQPIRPQQFEQPQASRQQQFEQPQAPRQQQFEQPQAPRQQQFEQPQAPRQQQFEQPHAPRQQFEQTTAQQVNQHYFNQPPQPQSVEHPQDQYVVRRPAHVVRTQPLESQRPQQSQFDQELFQQQAENARYTFASSISDAINDQENVREETRDGLNLKGLYSYSDGYYRRTVHYEADQNGYRVTKEEVDAIGDGPRGDPEGRADVTANVGGNNLQYSITAADIQSARATQPKAHSEHQPFAVSVGRPVA